MITATEFTANKIYGPGFEDPRVIDDSTIRRITVPRTGDCTRVDRPENVSLGEWGCRLIEKTETHLVVDTFGYVTD